ncbi:hypothetical protein PYW07_001075 [Mythimna separata]|uniref:C2H2-type domain-containing protein n=1 Tax=Mythimna separata TaxID=271217 RepID=A0AAD7YRM1_MYTSE|nr:hypothetical protein PYW07_001075 [Mythimna separata]
MNRPPRPRMINNFQRSPMAHNYQWRPSWGSSPRCSWNNPRFGSPDINTENGEKHWCETCDREFPTEDLLQKHKQQHQKCNIDGCQFIAHPKVITKHIQMQHSTGLYKKIANLNNPEDIQKWREERKKKYPTKSNIEKKAAERQEKIERGEKMAMRQDYRNDKNRSTAQESNLKRKQNFDRRNQNQRMSRPNNRSNSITTTGQPAKKIPRIIPKAPTTAEKNKLKPFAGIVNIKIEENAEDTTELLDSTNGLIEDDDEESLINPKETAETQKPVLCGALSSLMCDYGSSDEETEEKENETLNKPTVIQNEKIEPPSNESNNTDTPVDDKSKLIEENKSDDEGPEEVKIVKTDIEHDTAPEAVPKTKENALKNIIPPRQVERQNYKLKRKIPSTLLQKLLHTEIRKERNIVLQCIRYIKKCNYFEKPN